jgi:hypothetical protein
MFTMSCPHKFDRHSATIHLNSILAAIRKTEAITDADRILVQAVLEVIGDIHSFGPLTFSVSDRSAGERITVFFDQSRVLSLDKSGDKIGINYVREYDTRWMEELVALANAHADLVLVGE